GLLALHLGLDYAHQVGAVIVGVACRVERLSEIFHELLGHLQLLRAHYLATWKVELSGIDELVGKAHDLENEGFANDLYTRKMLSLLDDDLADAHLSCLADGLEQKRVCILCS